MAQSTIVRGLRPFVLYSRLGTDRSMSAALLNCLASISAVVKAVIDKTGVSIRLSSRLRAVTMISSSVPAAAASPCALTASPGQTNAAIAKN